MPSKSKIQRAGDRLGGVNYVNPPYKDCAAWLAKGFAEWKRGRTSVFLIPSRTDTRYWHEFCMKATEIRFIKGRLRFDEHKNSSPFPSALVIFHA